MPPAIRDAVIVITGASSGIGRATALACARRGGAVVIAARRQQPLQELACQCEALGGRVLVVPTDVSDDEAVRQLACRAVETFGRVDVWLNNAAVTLFGRFEETPPDAYRRVIETNLFGYIHGARAALPYFREQGRGVLINVASVAGRVGQPYTSAYVTSKFAILGLSECLRQELRDADDIHVCTVLPASIDTPLFQHAANYTGRAVKPLRPVYDVERAAEAIVRLVESPRREVIVGQAGRGLLLLRTVAPAYGERFMAKKVERDHFQVRPAEPSPGNVFEPMPQYTDTRGGWRPPQATPALSLTTVGLTALGLGLMAWWRAHQV